MFKPNPDIVQSLLTSVKEVSRSITISTNQQRAPYVYGSGVVPARQQQWSFFYVVAAVVAAVVSSSKYLLNTYLQHTQPMHHYWPMGHITAGPTHTTLP